MDLSEAWKKLGSEKLSKPVAGSVDVPAASKHPVERLIWGFKVGLWFIVAFEVIFIYLLVIMPQPIVKASMGILVIIYLIFFAMNYRVLRKMISLNTLDTNTHEMLSGVLSIVTRTLDFQLKISWGFFPICTASGFFLGMSIKADAAELITRPPIYLALLATILIMTPTCYFLTRKMNQIAHGKYCDQIRSLLAQMDEK